MREGKNPPPSSEHSLIPILDSADIHPLTTSLLIINKSVGFLFIYLIFSALGDIQEVRECTSLWMVFSTIVEPVDWLIYQGVTSDVILSVLLLGECVIRGLRRGDCRRGRRRRARSYSYYCTYKPLGGSPLRHLTT